MVRRASDRLGRFEILGAWLRLWTPPRDAAVPPVPWRAVAVGAVVLVAAVGVATTLLLRAEADRREAREREQRAAAERHAAFLADVDREQRPHEGRGRPDSGARAPDDARRPVRRALLSAAESGIAADARERTRKRIRSVDCEPFPRALDATPPAADLSRSAAAYDCVAVTSRFATGVIGTPFRLVVHFDRGRFTWCRIVPLGDRDRLSHPLPRACRL
jgi:hypothetical protein